MASPRIAIFDPSDRARDDLRILAVEAGAVLVEADPRDTNRFASAIALSQPDLVLVCVSDQDSTAGTGALALLRRLAGHSPESLLALILPRPDGEMTVAARMAGVNEVLTEPLHPEEIGGLVDRVRILRGEATRDEASGAVVALAGTAGGIGATLAAVNLGVLAGRDPARRVLLVDLDLALGDADALVDLLPDFTVASWLRHSRKLDPAGLLRDVARHAGGLHLISRPATLDEAEEAALGDPGPALALARRTFGLTLCDLSKSFGPLDHAALAAADRVLLVTEVDVVALRSALRLLESFRQWGVSSERIELVAAGVRGSASPADIARAEAALSRSIRWRLPHEPSAAAPSRAAGTPLVDLAPRSDLALVLAEIADAVVQELVPVQRAR